VAHQTAKPVSDAGTGLGPAERRLLAAMPLHAITSVHGQAGLRERLGMEIAAFPAAGRDRVKDALMLASRLHAADRRQREPYANHLLRVTIRILSHYRVADPDVACAALLHDAVEDHAADIDPGGRPAALAVLAGRFGERTVQAGQAELHDTREHRPALAHSCPAPVPGRSSPGRADRLGGDLRR
jgi:hypothetical protein